MGNGGGYAGVCAGAYLALSGYRPETSLGLLRATALASWERGQARISVAPNGDLGRLLILGAADGHTTEKEVPYCNGPCMVPMPRESWGKVPIPDPDPAPKSMAQAEAKSGTPYLLATFSRGIGDEWAYDRITGRRMYGPGGEPLQKAAATGQPQSGDSDSRGTGAALCGNFGRGRVVLLSPHFESTDLNPGKSSCLRGAVVRRAVLWAAPPAVVS